MPRRTSPARWWSRACRRHGPLWSAVLLIAAVMVVSVVTAAWWQSRGERFTSTGDLILPRCVDALIFAWAIWIGSSIGSFLNVVAWRMPRGEGVGGRSMCPRCRTQLLARDNFPVLGWIALRGRCRVCRLQISPRYPIVEAVVGLLIAVLSMAQLYRLSLPYQQPAPFRGLVAIPEVDASLMLVLAYHVVAVSLSCAVGLIRIDSQRLPGRLVAIGLAGLIVPMLLYPPLMIVTWRAVPPSDPALATIPGEGHVDAIVRVITALAAAAFYGRSLARGFCPTADLKMEPLGKATARLLDLVVTILIPAIVIGWQSLPAVLMIASAVAVLIRSWLPGTDALGRFALSMPLALVLQLVLWRWSIGQAWWPGQGSDPKLLIAAAASVLLIPWWLRDRPRPQSVDDV